MLTVAFVAEALGLTEQRVRQLCASQQLIGAVKAGGTWRIPAAALAVAAAERGIALEGASAAAASGAAPGPAVDGPGAAPGHDVTGIEALMATARAAEQADRAEHLEFEVLGLRLELAEQRAAAAEARARQHRLEAERWKAAFAALMAAGGEG